MEADAAGPSVGLGGRFGKQNRRRRVEIRPFAVSQKSLEIGFDCLRRKPDAGQGARVLVDETVGRACDEGKIARRETVVDLFDGNAACDEPQPEKIGKPRPVGGEERRKAALVRQRGVVLRARRPGVEAEPHGIVAEHVVKAMDEAGIRPVETEADELDPVEAVRTEPRLQGGDRLVAALGRRTS